MEPTAPPRPSSLVSVLLIIVGVVGLLMSACGAFLSLQGIWTYFRGVGEARAWAPASIMMGVLFGLAPGTLLALVARFFWRRRQQAAQGQKREP